MGNHCPDYIAGQNMCCSHSDWSSGRLRQSGSLAVSVGVVRLSIVIHTVVLIGRLDVHVHIIKMLVKECGVISIL